MQGCARNPDYGARLNPPTGLHYSLSSGQIHLSWTATDSTPEADYKVYRARQARGPLEKVSTTRATSCDIALEANDRATQYFCVTASLNDAAESVCSNQVAVEPPPPPATNQH